jgi:hypothetical protein
MEGFRYSDEFLKKLEEEFPQAHFIIAQAKKGRYLAVEYHLKGRGAHDLVELSETERKNDTVATHDLT